MRVLIDANVFISYLLKRDAETPIRQLITAGILGEFTLLLAGELLQEVEQKVRTKKYLQENIRAEDVEELLSLLTENGETIPTITEPIPRASRDRKDDYLLAYALVGQADYLVTGDKDLLVLAAIDTLKIVTPATFAQILGTNR